MQFHSRSIIKWVEAKIKHTECPHHKTKLKPEIYFLTFEEIFKHTFIYLLVACACIGVWECG